LLPKEKSCNVIFQPNEKKKKPVPGIESKERGGKMEQAGVY